MSLLAGVISCISCNDQSKTSQTQVAKDSTVTVSIKEDSISYTVDGKEFKGYVVYNENNKDKRPAILVVHEWWGLGDYSRSRAKQLAEMGYIAMAVDVFGNGATADDPAQAQMLATPFYKDPQLAKARLDAAIDKIKNYPQTDTAKIAAIGYCFGGYVVLNAAKLGANLKGVVSFHGGLGGAPVKKELVKSDILICHGEADDFVNAEVQPFKKSMDSAGVSYTFKSYADATHAFTNPGATEKGKKFNMPIKYNEAADKESWNDMKLFFNKIFFK